MFSNTFMQFFKIVKIINYFFSSHYSFFKVCIRNRHFHSFHPIYFLLLFFIIKTIKVNIIVFASIWEHLFHFIDIRTICIFLVISSNSMSGTYISKIKLACTTTCFCYFSFITHNLHSFYS